MSVIFDGYKVAGTAIDDIGQAALDTMWSVMDEAPMHCEFVLEPGRIECLGKLAGRASAHRLRGLAGRATAPPSGAHLSARFPPAQLQRVRAR
jgi:hypothetical protein